MRRTLRIGVASAALGAAAVGLAGPAAAAPAVTQGTALSVPSGQCSLTLVNDTTAYTAEHCGAGTWEVGSPVHTAEGERIGAVSATDGPQGVDAVQIALDEGVEVIGEWGTRAASQVASEETLYTHGSSVPMGAENSMADGTTFNISQVCDDVYTDQAALDAATTHAGDSGGAVYDAQQRVVGVISGLAPLEYDANGNLVGCQAEQMSTIFVPVESLDQLEAQAPTAEQVPAEQAPAEQPAAEAPAEQPVAEQAPAEQPAAEQPVAEQAPAAEQAPTEQLTAEQPAAETAPQPAAEQAPAATGTTQSIAPSSAYWDAYTYSTAPAAGVAAGTPMRFETTEGGFELIQVTSYDASGAVTGTYTLDLAGEPYAWGPVPGEVPAGGWVDVTTVDGSAGAPQMDLTLGTDTISSQGTVITG